MPMYMNYFGHGNYTGAVLERSIVPSSDKEAYEPEYVPHGKGIWTATGDDDEDGCSYTGDWKDGKRHGFGTMTT
jgi:hypothetical protein